MKNTLTAISIFFGTFFVASAQGQVNGSWLLSLLNLAQTVVNKLSPILVTLALLAFFWFLIQFIWKGAENPKAHQDGMKGMGYAILALFVMVSIWGIIATLQSIFGVPNLTQPDVPVLPPSMRNQ